MASKTDKDRKKRAMKIVKALKKIHNDATIALDFKNPLELLVATILSAQCTDKRVNKVTADLFKKYKKASDFAEAPQEELEEDIRSTGFYKNKAKSIRACCADIAGKHRGKVPGSMDELTRLAGVGRKTANVLLGTVFGVPGIVVDTHVSRLSGRLGLSDQKNADKIEQDLMKLLPEKEWTEFSSRLILFGRNTCKAKKPKCGECGIYDLCPWDEKG